MKFNQAYQREKRNPLRYDGFNVQRMQSSLLRELDRASSIKMKLWKYGSDEKHERERYVYHPLLSNTTTA